MASWILKSEPTDYPFSKLQKEKKTQWTGVKNPLARKNLSSMQPGELALFYHTGKEKAVVGIAKILSNDGENVDIAPVKSLSEPVALATLKADAKTKEISVVRMGRLSVGTLTDAQFSAVLKLSKTSL